jgi:hypothetical protein
MEGNGKSAKIGWEDSADTHGQTYGIPPYWFIE